MADEQVPDEPPSAQPPSEATPSEEEEKITRIHDKYFYRVFSDTDNAAGLLRPYLPPAVAGSLRWATLTHWPGRFVSDDWRGREADLVFSAERQGTEEPVLVYVLLEHQSTPRYWMALRVLNYCLQIWVAWQGASRNKKKTKLPLIVPLVFYQGGKRWSPELEFRELVEGAAAEWRWVPRFEYLLIDQTKGGPEAVLGSAVARLTQIAMMARVRGGDELVERTAVLMAEVSPEGEVEVLARHVEYVLATQSEEGLRAFGAALRRNVPGRGGELMTYVEQIEERGRREGRQEGRREGRQEGRREGVLRTIEGFLQRDVPWSTIEEATSIDKSEFERLRQQLDAAAPGADQPN